MIDAYGRWFPDYPGQQIYQDPQYIAKMQQQTVPQQVQQAQQAQQHQAQTMTPYIDARMLQVPSVDVAEAYQMAPGASQMFYTEDRNTLIIKEQGQTGYNLMIYDRRPPEPKAPTIDPARFVTRDEFEQRLAAFSAPISAPANAPRPARTTTKGDEK